METRTFWLSFADNGFKGACVVDVTTDDRRAMETDLQLGPFAETYDEDKGPWVAAAARVAHAHGCNPGGEVLAWRVDDMPPEGLAELAKYPKNVLLSKEALTRLSGAPLVRVPHGSLPDAVGG